MVKTKEGWPASSPLAQEKTECFDDGCLASETLAIHKLYREFPHSRQAAARVTLARPFRGQERKATKIGLAIPIQLPLSSGAESYVSIPFRAMCENLKAGGPKR
jgi:hypothetical protein